MGRKGKKRSKTGRKFGCLPLCCGAEDTRVVDIAGDFYEQPEEEEKRDETQKKPSQPPKEDEATLYSLTSIGSFVEKPFLEDKRSRQDNPPQPDYLSKKIAISADISIGSPSLPGKEKEIHTIVNPKHAQGYQYKACDTKVSAIENEDAQSVLDLSWGAEKGLELGPKDEQVSDFLTNFSQAIDIPSETSVGATAELTRDGKSLNAGNTERKDESKNSWGSEMNPSLAEPKVGKTSAISTMVAQAALDLDAQERIGHVLKKDTILSEAASVMSSESDSNVSLEHGKNGEAFKTDNNGSKAQAKGGDTNAEKEPEVILLEARTSDNGLTETPVDIPSQIEQDPSKMQDEQSEDFSFDETIPMKISIKIGKATESPVQSSNEEQSGFSKMVEPGTAHIELSSDSWPSIDDQIFDTEAVADQLSNDFIANADAFDGKEVTEICIESVVKKQDLTTEAGETENCVGSFTNDQINQQTEASMFDGAASKVEKGAIDTKNMAEGSDSGSLTDPELYRVVDFQVSPYVSSDSSVEKVSSAKSIFNQEKQLATVGKDISSMDVEKKTLPPLGSEPTQGSSSLSVKPKSKVSFESAVSLRTVLPHDHVKQASDSERPVPLLTKLSRAKEFESDQIVGHSDQSSNLLSHDRQLMLHRAKIEPLRVSKSDVPSHKQGHSAALNIQHLDSTKNKDTTFASVKVVEGESSKLALPRHQFSQMKGSTSSDLNEQSCHLSSEYKERVNQGLLTHLYKPKQQSALSSDHHVKSFDSIADKSHLHLTSLQSKELSPQLQRPQPQSLTSSDLIGENSRLRPEMQKTNLPGHLHRPQIQPATSDHSQPELSRPNVQLYDMPSHLHRAKIQPPRVGIGQKHCSLDHESISHKSEEQSSSGSQAHLHRPQLQPLKVPVSGSDLKKKQLQQTQTKVEKAEYTSYVVGSSIEQISRPSSCLPREPKQTSFERVMNLDGTILLDHPQAETFQAQEDTEPELGTVLHSGSRLRRPTLSPPRVNTPSTPVALNNIPFSPSINKNLSSSNKNLPSSLSSNNKLPSSPSSNNKLPSSPSSNNKLPSSLSSNNKLPSSPPVNNKLQSSLSVNNKLPSSLSVNKKLPSSPPDNKNLLSSPAVKKNHVSQPSGSGKPSRVPETILNTINLDQRNSSRLLEGPHTSVQPAKWNPSSQTRIRLDPRMPEPVPSPYAKSAQDGRVVVPQATSKSLSQSTDALSQATITSNVESAAKQTKMRGTKCRRDMLAEKNLVPKSPSPPKDGRPRRGKTYGTKMRSDRAEPASPYSKEPCPPPLGKKTRSQKKVLTPPLNASDSSSSEIKLRSTRPKTRAKMESGKAESKSHCSKEPCPPSGKKTRQRVSSTHNDTESSSSEMELHSPRPAWNLLKADTERVSLSGSVETNLRSPPNKGSSSDCAAASDITDNEEAAQIQEEERRPHVPKPPSSPPPTSGRRHSRPFPPLRRQRLDNQSLETTASTGAKPRKQVTFNLPNIDHKTPTESPPGNRQN